MSADRSWATRVRGSLGARATRLRTKAWLIGQSSIAAAAAWWLALHVLGHQRPFLAPVAAIVCLGVSYGQRLRRVAEVMAGVALGVGVADVFVLYAGTGVWQVTAVVAASMIAAVLLQAGPLMITQAAVQSAIIATLLPEPGAGLERWLDAVLGGLVALVAAAVVPRAPLRRPREHAAKVARELAELLRATTDRISDGDLEAAEQILEQARETEPALDDLRAAADEGLDVVASSPLRFRHRTGVRLMADLIGPLDHAIRNVRVLIRRLVAAVRNGEQIPPSYGEIISRLAAAVDSVATELAQGRMAIAARPELVAIGVATATLPAPSGLSGAVVLAQIRSIVVDLLEISGLTTEEAFDVVPPRDVA